MSEEYAQLLSDFYELKKKYEKNNEKMKKKIKNDEGLSREQKREKLRSLRPKCVKCKKPVGTIFEIKRDELRAICGAHNPQMASEGYTPCSLNINIKKPNIVNLEVAIKEARENRDKIMEQITLNKVRMLYLPREKQVELVEQTEELKLEYRQQSDILETYIKKHLELTANEEKVKELLLKSYEISKEIISLIKEKKTKEAVEMYIDSYAPTISLETREKYKHMYVEEDGKNMYYLKEVTPENSLDVLDISIDNGPISKKSNNNSNNNSNNSNIIN